MKRTILFSIIALFVIAALSCSTESTPAYTLTTTASPAEGGTITPNAGTFEEGEAVSLESIPVDGWVFVRWEQDVNSTANPMNITMNRDYNVVGVFTTDSGSNDVVEVTNPATGRTWMDRNLGASRAATSSSDTEAYGDLYQWGRAADGHEKRNSGTTSTLSSTDQPGHGDFILVSGNPYDWRSPQNDNLWQGVNGVNNPCPDGFRVPTEAEWEAERQSWSSNDAAGAFASPLKLPVAGGRHGNDGTLDVSSYGNYWSSTISGILAWDLLFSSSGATTLYSKRVGGLSVRCIKN